MNLQRGTADEEGRRPNQKEGHANPKDFSAKDRIKQFTLLGISHFLDESFHILILAGWWLSRVSSLRFGFVCLLADHPLHGLPLGCESSHFREMAEGMRMLLDVS